MEKTQKFAAYFTDDQKEKIARCQDLDGSRSAAEVVRNAVNFYYGYLTADNAGLFLPQSIQSYLDGRLGMLEKSLSAITFEMLVEIDMLSQIIAESFEFSQDDLRRRRANSIRNVKATNGLISLKKRAKLKEDDEWQG